MLADEHSYERLFRRALAWSEGAQQPFELARTQLCFGERLHREGRLPEACTRVAAALSSFEALGARPWARRAKRLLNAWGQSRPSPARPRHGRPVGADLGPCAAELGGVEAEGNHGVGSLALRLLD
jgi:hypothetical protein